MTLAEGSQRPTRLDGTALQPTAEVLTGEKLRDTAMALRANVLNVVPAVAPFRNASWLAEDGKFHGQITTGVIGDDHFHLKVEKDLLEFTAVRIDLSDPLNPQDSVAFFRVETGETPSIITQSEKLNTVAAASHAAEIFSSLEQYSDLDGSDLPLNQPTRIDFSTKISGMLRSALFVLHPQIDLSGAIDEQQDVELEPLLTRSITADPDGLTIKTTRTIEEGISQEVVVTVKKNGDFSYKAFSILDGEKVADRNNPPENSTRAKGYIEGALGKLVHEKVGRK